ncbi:MAG: NAD(P)-dependent oxidoreductase [SAR202 cluster bacterium]|nr:NAD(P)-dependent oxidoreductase [SAR202 cluster bacterium]
MKVLITGAAGTIGRILTKAFLGKYELRGLDRSPMQLLTDTVEGDVTDYATVARATAGMDAVIHLTNVRGKEFEYPMQSITGTYNVFESSRVNGVTTIAFASRGGLFPWKRIPRSVTRTADMLWQPSDFYTITKVVGEGFGDMYSSRYGLSVVSVRIGSIDPEEQELNHPHILSHRDCVAVFEAAIKYRGGKHERVFGVSDSNWLLYDVENGRKTIGYYPKDKSIVPESEIER